MTTAFLCRRMRQSAVALALAFTSPVASVAGSQTGDAVAAQHRSDGQWADAHGGPSGWHYSALDEINVHNVSRLRQVWTHSPDLQTEGLESLPVAADGLLAYCSGSDQLWVLDGATGRLRWHAHLASPPDARPAAPCRGLAISNGTVYFAGAGGRVGGWSLATGEARWEVQALPRDGASGTLTGPPMVIGDRVIVGSQVANLGERGVLLGLDARTGRESWRLELIGGSIPAAPGGRAPALDANASWGSGLDHASGGSAAMPGAYDPVTNTLYWGVGSPLPLFDAAGTYYQTHGPRPGDNLHTAGVLAIDPATGALRAWHQEIPHEVWVRDSAQSETILIERDGRRYLVHPNRTGLVFVYGPDLKVQRVWSGVRNLNVANGFDPQTGALRRRHDLDAGDRSGICPLVDGAFPSLAGTYSPQTGLWYKVGAEWCMDIDLDHPVDPASPGALLGGRFTAVPPRDGRVRAHLDARNPLTGAKVWTVGFPEPPLASLLSTAGRLLFVADGRGGLQALDAGNGTELWHAEGTEGHAGGLISYLADGHQYIAVVAGWDSRAHPVYGKLFGAPYNANRTPHASLRVYRLP